MKVLCIITNGLGNCGITNNTLLYYTNMKQMDIAVDMLKINCNKDLKNIENKIKRSGVRIVQAEVKRKNIIFVLKN